MDLDATAFWIARSGLRPLSIGINLSRYRAYGPFLPQILGSIVSQSFRWKDIEMTIPVELESILLAPFAAGSLPHLANFTSTIPNPSSTTIHFLALHSAPRLQLLQSCAYHVHIDFRGRPHDIKSLRITDGGISLDDLVFCFTHCPLLSDLVVSVRSGPTTILPCEPSTTIELAYLRHVTLSLSTGADPGLLFDRLLLRALISLDLRMDVEGTADWPSLKSMLARSRPTLEVLMLDGVPIFETTLTECISYTPALTNLATTGVECTDTTLHALTLDESGTRGLCPLLERIDLENAEDCSPNVMIEMILSRRTRPESANITTRQRLKHLNFGLFELDNIRSNPHIAECEKDGMRLSNY
ncbi:hypothetical protein BD410DRAFT_901034 [Rickenella mellea]|uniref:F-box domain-containing protein n=1 Tax=Rickenella mellea TaxID=50990 RepID=A0A4Y7PRX0_9AGAM|nr:hypothetical protein BD410DRAFT_901034 [Rickenella mellea]